MDDQSESRRLYSEILQTPKVYEYIINPDDAETYSRETVQQAKSVMHVITNFYVAIFRQREFKLIEDSFWKSYNEEVCGLLQKKHYKEFWDQDVKKGSYPEGFKNLDQICP